VLGHLRVGPQLPLDPLVRSGDPEKEALALRLGRLFPARLNPLAIDRGFASREQAVRAAALETGMVLWGSAARSPPARPS